MVAGVIPINGLNAVVEVFFDDIPNPSRPIRDHDRVHGLRPLPLPSFSPQRLGKFSRPTQVGDISGMDGMGQVDHFSRLFILGRAEFGLKDTADFDFFPAFLSHRHQRPIQAGPQARPSFDFAGHHLLPAGQGAGNRPLNFGLLFEFRAPLIGLPPDSGGRDGDLPDLVQHFRRLGKIQ